MKITNVTARVIGVLGTDLMPDESMEITAKLEPPITHDEALAFMKDNSGVRKVSV